MSALSGAQRVAGAPGKQRVLRDSEGPRGVKFQSQDADQYAFTDTPALSQADEGSAGALPSRRRQQLAKELRRGKKVG